MSSPLILSVAIASVVAIGGWTSRSGARPSEVTVLRGTADTVNATGTAIGFAGRRLAGARLRIADVDGSWIVAGANWFDGRTWHDNGSATCLDGASLRSRWSSGSSKPHRLTTPRAGRWSSG